MKIHMNDRNYSYRGSGTCTCISGRGVHDHIPGDILATTGRRSKMISLKRNVLVPSHNSIVYLHVLATSVTSCCLQNSTSIKVHVHTVTITTHLMGLYSQCITELLKSLTGFLLKNAELGNSY